MTKFMIGRKVGMTQLFDENGRRFPSTVIDAGRCLFRTRILMLTVYQASRSVTVSGRPDKVIRPVKGQYEKIGVEPRKVMREFKTDETFEPGQEIKVSDMFQAGDQVDINGISKGKGYAGTIKRYGQKGGPESHGSMYHRRVGSMGANTDPARVFKGKKMPGQMGNVVVTVQNLKVVMADGERNILVVKGAVPGPKGGLVEITTSVKAK